MRFWNRSIISLSKYNQCGFEIGSTSNLFQIFDQTHRISPQPFHKLSKNNNATLIWPKTGKEHKIHILSSSPKDAIQPKHIWKLLEMN